MAAIRLENVSKSYRIYPSQIDRLKEVASFGRIQRGHDFWALRDISLEVERGTTLGILGRNGAGKSTLLQVISGFLPPTTGSVEAKGQLVFLQLGAGFNKEFTGRENVMLNGLILGIDRRKMLERFDEIEAFADLGEFMDQPLKTYSSGMRARLGFAVAVNVEPDILVVDETLSVGDAVFKQMGLQRMRELRDRGTTILFVSHGAGMVKSFCSEAILLHKGRLLSSGDTSEILDHYKALTSRAKARQGSDDDPDPEDEGYDIAFDGEGEETPSFKENSDLDRRRSRLRHGTGEARISDVEVLDETRQPAVSVNSGDTITVRVHVQYEEAVKPSKLSITLRNKTGLDVFSTSTTIKAPENTDETRAIADFTFELPLKPGDYSVNAAVSHHKDKTLYFDWVDVAAVFELGRGEGKASGEGLLNLPAEAEVHHPARNP
ncbi:MAG: ABC transporter ATP-binding protein [Actinomycetota bacterium]|nr:ABC transporter ATP-binding protein [Actinomycetota bacterium]